jgi:hypothetical protein
MGRSKNSKSEYINGKCRAGHGKHSKPNYMCSQFQNGYQVNPQPQRLLAPKKKLLQLPSSEERRFHSSKLLKLSGDQDA